MTATPDPAEVERPRYEITGYGLIAYVGGHTCGTSPDGHFGAHEPWCGWEPVCTLDELDELVGSLRAALPAPVAAEPVAPDEPAPATDLSRLLNDLDEHLITMLYRLRCDLLEEFKHALVAHPAPAEPPAPPAPSEPIWEAGREWGIREAMAVVDEGLDSTYTREVRAVLRTAREQIATLLPDAPAAPVEDERPEPPSVSRRIFETPAEMNRRLGIGAAPAVREPEAATPTATRRP